jgi:hypothetical protein
MSLLTDKERKDWIINNVPYLLEKEFLIRLNNLRDAREEHNTKTLERLLELVKIDKLESEEYDKKIRCGIREDLRGEVR